MTEDDFIAACRTGGWSDPTTVVYAPSQRPDPHTHPFDAFLVMTSGSMTLALEDGDIVLKPGETCEVPSGTVHAEHGGPDGGTALVARRAVG